MKLLIVSFLAMLLYSCDPNNKDIFNFERVSLKAEFNNTAESILLGDTITLSITIPDTIVNSTGTFPVQSLQEAQFYMSVNKLDTVNIKSVVLSPPTYWTSVGIISPTNSFDFQFKKDSKPYKVVIHFKPIEKGLYLLNVVSQPGKLRINTQYEARLVIGFNVPDRHISLASPHFDAAWTNDAITREPGTYVFRVN